MLGTSAAYSYVPIPSRYYSGVGFPSLRVKDSCSSPERCALDLCGSQQSLGSSQSQPKAETNICSDELLPKRQKARVSSCSADNCLSPGFRTGYEGTFLSIDCKERMSSSLYHRHHLWYVSHSSETSRSIELWSSPYHVCSLSTTRLQPQGAEKNNSKQHESYATFANTVSRVIHHLYTNTCSIWTAQL